MCRDKLATVFGLAPSCVHKRSTRSERSDHKAQILFVFSSDAGARGFSRWTNDALFDQIANKFPDHKPRISRD